MDTDISLKMIQCYGLVSLLRLCSILFFEGYLPFDSSGDWFYQTVEVLTLLLAGLLRFVRLPTACNYQRAKPDILFAAT